MIKNLTTIFNQLSIHNDKKLFVQSMEKKLDKFDDKSEMNIDELHSKYNEIIKKDRNLICTTNTSRNTFSPSNKVKLYIIFSGLGYIGNYSFKDFSVFMVSKNCDLSIEGKFDYYVIDL